MIVTAKLTPVETPPNRPQRYQVSGTGQPSFWPHDGDIIEKNDIAWLTDKKGWHVEIENDD